MNSNGMKTGYSYLPEAKQQEISCIAEITQAHDQVEMVILFGSYARNDWVEELDDQGRFKYQSDFDILVLVNTLSMPKQDGLEVAIEKGIAKDERIKTPVSVIVHDVKFINRRLRKAQYFFSDIKKEGICLYDSGECELAQAKELVVEERRSCAQDFFEYYITTSNNFKKLCDFAIREGGLNEAAFLLHQTTERLYTAILLVYTNYKPNSHDLQLLRQLSNAQDNRLVKVFPLDTVDNIRLFKLLRKAYVSARYNRAYRITHEELVVLRERVDHLFELTDEICREKIDGF